MKKRFKYKPEIVKQPEETLLVKIISFPGYFSIAVAWLFVAASGLYTLLSTLNSNQSFSYDQSLPQPELIYQSSSIIVLCFVSIAVWWFIARVVHRLLQYIYTKFFLPIGFVIFCIIVNSVGWLLFVPLVGFMWALDLRLVIIVGLIGFVIGSISFITESLMYKNLSSGS